MIAKAPTTIDWWIIAAILMLLLVLVVFSIAEMGLSRMSKPKAQALADSGAKGGASLLSLVRNPEKWVNPLLLSVNICQTVQATLTGVVAGRLFGAAGVVTVYCSTLLCSSFLRKLFRRHTQSFTRTEQRFRQRVSYLPLQSFGHYEWPRRH
jgi:CBS domain containing-hemolysin-like protein